MQLVKENGPYDILHSHLHHFSGFVCLLGKRSGIPMRIAHSHNDTRPKESTAGLLRKGYLRMMKRMIFFYATHGLACSGLAAEDLFGSHWVADSRWRILYCGIELTPFEMEANKAQLRAEFGIPADSFVVGHVGRFDLQKNHQFLIDIIKHCVRCNPNCYALLVGDGPLRTAIEDKVRKMELENRVIFTGVRSDVPQIMKGCMDVFVFPSFHEGLSIVLIEAQAAGLRCFVSDRVTREASLVNGAIQFIGLDKQPEYWAEEVLRVSAHADSAHDPVGILRNSNFSIRNSTQHLRDLYDEALCANGCLR
jgi:glycosyltransferase involved in cell wall biosynthesis